MLASDIHTPTTNVFDVLFKGKPLILFSIYISGLIEVIIHEDKYQKSNWQQTNHLNYFYYQISNAV